MTAPADLPLFPGLAPVAPEGFDYRPRLISPEMEGDLIDRFASLDFEPFDFRGFKANRRVVAFGSRVRDGFAALSHSDGFPPWLIPLRDAAAGFAGLTPDALSRALIIDYPPGAGIGWHRDRPHYDQIVGVSLGSAAPLRLRRPTTSGWERRTVRLEPRSVYRLGGPVRDDWEHSIPPGEARRYAITFRSLR